MFGQYLVGWPEKKFMLVKKISLSRVGTDYILATDRLKNSPYFTFKNWINALPGKD